MRSSSGGCVENSFVDPDAFERIDDVERLGRRVDLHRQRLPAPLELLQRLGERLARSEHPRRGRVREVLALPRDGELEQRRRDRGDDDHQQAADRAERVVVVVAAEEAHEEEDVRDRRDRAGDHRRDRRDEDVAVLDVRELVGEHAANLVAREVLQQPLRDRDRRVLRVPPGRERVRLLGRDHVDARLRDAVELRELGDHVVQVRRLRLGDLLCAGGLDRELVRPEVGRQVHQDREDHEEPERGPSDRPANADEQRGEPGEEDPGTGLGAEACLVEIHGTPFG